MSHSKLKESDIFIMIMFKMSSSLVNKILNRSTNVFGNRNEKVNKGNKKTNPHRCS